ncbi:MAG: aromatic ring-hydroxylating dioxygenase subunit alpha [Verrucomicrobiales bacterium]|nr:aromatic ring-hydroxylating dioxygenase subunit alpha [Verrucomicrobiales bacterium]
MTTAAPPSPVYHFPKASPVPDGIEALFSQVLEAAALPREKAQSSPAGIYTSPEFLDFETQAIFRKEWISLAHVSQVPNPGDYLRVDLCGEPMLVTRGKDDVVRVLSRVCRHRGMDLMPEGGSLPNRGNQRVILCPYHLWSYDLNGRMLGAPEMQQADGFDRSEVCLHQFRSEIWEGFVFVTLNPEAPPLAEKFGRLRSEFLSGWNMGEAKLVWDQHWDCGFNWKILLENFMEAYHHLGAHRKTLEPFLPAKGCWTVPEDPDFSAMHLPLRPDLVETIRTTGEAGTTMTPFPGLGVEDYTEWWVFLGYPTFLLFTAPDRVYWYRLLPTGPETCSLTTTLLVHPATMERADYNELYQSEIEAAINFHLEDMEVCAATQNGMRSSAYEPGRLSHLEEPIWQFQRYLANKIREFA